jgi:hypothetical protein
MRSNLDGSAWKMSNAPRVDAMGRSRRHAASAAYDDYLPGSLQQHALDTFALFAVAAAAFHQPAVPSFAYLGNIHSVDDALHGLSQHSELLSLPRVAASCSTMGASSTGSRRCNVPCL